MAQTVGLTGYARSGKDTAAKALLDIGWERRAFADPLRGCLLALDPIVSAAPVEAIIKKQRADGVTGLTPGYGVDYLRLSQAVNGVGWDEAKKLTEIRRLMQVFGTEVVRDHFGSDTWTEYARSTMVPGVDYVFTDCRFPNEVEFVHQMGGLVIRVERPGVGPVNAHASDDIAGLHVDYVLTNDGAVGDLWNNLLGLVQ